MACDPTKSQNCSTSSYGVDQKVQDEVIANSIVREVLDGFIQASKILFKKFWAQKMSSKTLPLP